MKRKEDTPVRKTRRKYEEKNKEKRKQASGNFGTMIPRALSPNEQHQPKNVGLTCTSALNVTVLSFSGSNVMLSPNTSNITSKRHLSALNSTSCVSP